MSAARPLRALLRPRAPTWVGPGLALRTPSLPHVEPEEPVLHIRSPHLPSRSSPLFSRVLLALLAVAPLTACDPGVVACRLQPCGEGEGEGPILGEGEGEEGEEGEGEEGEGEGEEGEFEGGGDEGEGEGEGESTNIGFGGAGDFAFVRRLLDAGVVPEVADIDDVGFFAEHHTPLPPATCGDRICPQSMFGVMRNLVDGGACTLLQVGLNSPLTIDPDARPPLTLAVAVDVSGSMAGGDKIGFVRQGLRRLVSELRDDDQLALIAYSTRARVALPLTPVRGNRNEMNDVIDSFGPEGSTNIFEGLDFAFSEVLGGYDETHQHRVVLISDGVATAGITSRDAILELARSNVSEGIPLTTIGVGVDFDLALMRTLAEEGDGNSYFLEDAVGVDEVFTEEVATFLMPVGYDITLTIDLGDEWNLRQAYGVRDFVAADLGRGGSVTLPAVYLAGRVSADDTFEGSGRRGGGSALLLEIEPAVLNDTDGESHVADVRVQFHAPGAVEPSVTLRTSDIAIGATEVPTRGEFENRIVEKSFVMLNLLVGMRAASQAFYAGADGEAVDVIDNVIAAAADYEDSANEGAGDADIAADLITLRQFRAVLLQNGASDGSDVVDEDPWPAD